MKKEITKKFNEFEKRIDNVEEEVRALQIFTADQDDKNTIVCHKCSYVWRTKSKLSVVSCPNCGAKAKRISEREAEREAKEWLKKEIKINKSYPTRFH